MIIYDVILYSRKANLDGETVSMKEESFMDTVLGEKIHLFFAWHHLTFNNFCMSFYGLHNE